MNQPRSVSLSLFNSAGLGLFGHFLFLTLSFQFLLPGFCVIPSDSFNQQTRHAIEQISAHIVQPNKLSNIITYMYHHGLMHFHSIRNSKRLLHNAEKETHTYIQNGVNRSDTSVSKLSQIDQYINENYRSCPNYIIIIQTESIN